MARMPPAVCEVGPMATVRSWRGMSMMGMTESFMIPTRTVEAISRWICESLQHRGCRNECLTLLPCAMREHFSVVGGQQVLRASVASARPTAKSPPHDAGAGQTTKRLQDQQVRPEPRWRQSDCACPSIGCPPLMRALSSFDYLATTSNIVIAVSLTDNPPAPRS